MFVVCFESQTQHKSKLKENKVWDQGGFEAKYKTEEKFNRACEADPTVSHKFQEFSYEKLSGLTNILILILYTYTSHLPSVQKLS